MRVKNGIECYFLWCERESTLCTIFVPQRVDLRLEGLQNHMELNTKRVVSWNGGTYGVSVSEFQIGIERRGQQDVDCGDCYFIFCTICILNWKMDQVTKKWVGFPFPHGNGWSKCRPLAHLFFGRCSSNFDCKPSSGHVGPWCKRPAILPSRFRILRSVRCDWLSWGKDSHSRCHSVNWLEFAWWREGRLQWSSVLPRAVPTRLSTLIKEWGRAGMGAQFDI